MSVEERLRQAYRQDESPVTGLASRYEAVVSGSRRRHRQRVLAGGLAIAVAAVVTAMAALSASRPADTLEPAPPGSSVTGTTDDIIAGGLEGTWRSLPLTRAQVAQGLRDAGFEEYAADYVRTQLPRGTFRIHLRLDEVDGVSVRIGNGETRSSHILSVEADRIELRPKGDRAGTSTYSWSLNGGALFLHFESATRGAPVTPGAFPTGVYDVATYNLAVFTRVE